MVSSECGAGECGAGFNRVTSRLVRNGKKPGLAPIVEIKRSVRKAQEDGKRYLKELVFPLFSRYIREVVTYGNFLFAFILFLITLITVAASSTRTVVDFVNLGFSTVSWLLTSMDLIIAIYFHRCKLACDIYKYCRDRTYSTDEEATSSSTCCISARGSSNDEVDSGNEAATSSPDRGQCDQCCKLCCKNKYADLFRLLLIEVFAYPITICSMLKVFLSIHLRSEDGIDVSTDLGITGFVVSALWNIFFIYVLRSFVILRTICAIETYREDGPVSGTGRSYPYWFFAHVIMQMVAQILMIVCIAAKMYYENRNFPADSTVRISPYLWYMILGGFFIPLAGIFTFLIYSYYYIEEYPIGLFVDLLYTVIKKRGMSDVKGLGMTEEAKEDAIQIAEKIVCDYNEIHDVGILNKYGSVFISPFLVALSIVYALFLLAFAICCMLAPDPTTGETNLVVLHGSTTGWVVFFVVGIILINLLNMFVVLVAGVWIAIIIAVIIVIVLVITFIVLIIAILILGIIYTCTDGACSIFKDDD